MPMHTRRISVASTSAEVARDPLVVEIEPGVEVRFLPLMALDADDLEVVAESLYSMSDQAAPLESQRMGNLHVLTAMNKIVPRCLSPRDLEIWRAAKVPFAAQLQVFDALITFYGEAGSPGEGSASAT